MVNVRLYINNSEVDLADKEKLQIATTYSINDIREISVTKSSVSKTISIPATENNKRIFGFAEDVHSLISFNNAVKSEGFIQVDGTEIIRGAVKLSKPVIDAGGKIKMYNIAILSGVADWKVDITGLNIRDLDFSQYNHAYTQDNQILSETINGTEGTLEDRFVVYPLIDYGDFEGQDVNREVATVDRKPAWSVYEIFKKIFENQGFTIASNFIHGDFFRRLYMPFTNEKLYAAEGSDSANQFRITNSTENYYGTLYNTPTVQIADQLLSDPVGGAGYTLNTIKIPFDDETSAGYFDNPNSVTVRPVHNYTGDLEAFPSPFSGSYYEAPARSRQRFVAKLKGSISLLFDFGGLVYTLPTTTHVIYPVVTIEAKFSIRINNTNRIVVQSVTLNVSDPLPTVPTTITRTFDTKLESDFVDLEAGDTVAVHVDYIINNNQEATGGFYDNPDPNIEEQLLIRLSNLNSSLTLDAGSEFFNEYDLELQVGGTLDVSTNFPDVQQMDLIKSLRHLFNLYFYTDVINRTVYIEPRDDFYSNQAVDWIGKVDISKPIEVEYLGDKYNKLNRLRYKSDSKDFPVEEYEADQEEGFVLAAQKYELDYIFAQEGLKEIENPIFAPTIMDNPEQLVWKINRVPKLWKEFKDEETVPEFDTNFMPRILYYDGVKSILGVDAQYHVVDFKGQINDLLSSITATTTAAEKDAIFLEIQDRLRSDYPYMYSTDDLALNDNSLYFETRDKSHGLFDKYYRNTVKILNEGRLVRCQMYLTPLDIANLDFRNPVIIELDGEPIYFTINKIIDYNPTKEGTTKVELLTAVGSEPLEAVLNTPDIQTTGVIQKRVRKIPLQTNEDGIIVDVFTDENGNIVQVFGG